MKNKVELKSWFEDDKLYVGEYVKHKIDQLDEPEVLSQEWIDRHTYYEDEYDFYYADPDDLQNLLVPKQEKVNVYVGEKKKVKVPKFVADWISEIKPDNSLRVAFEYIARRKIDNYDDELAFWVEEGNSETFARAWLDGYEIEQEQKYYAVVKGGDLLSEEKYWNLWVENGTLEIGDNKVHSDVIAEYMLKATKDEWNKLGINDANADFEEADDNG